MEKPNQSEVSVCIGVLAPDGTVAAPMAMFLASQPYFFKEFDCKVFDGRYGGGWNEIYGWLARQSADYYVLANANIAPDPNILTRLVDRKAHVVVPPIYERFVGERLLNVEIEGNPVTAAKDCGYQECSNATMSFLCLSRAALSSLVMAGEVVNEVTLMAPIKALGYRIFIDWTIAPTLRWGDEASTYGNRMLQAYGVWYTRVKRGLPI